MNWITDLQKAVNFMEENMLREISVEDVANHIHISKDYFAKIFTIITGYSVGEYIRNRRLSMAAQELAFTQENVLEIAQTYMYESPESFSKAFTRLYGFTPSQFRAQNIKPIHFYPLTIQTTIKGGFNMKANLANQEIQPLIQRINENFTNDDIKSIMGLIDFCYENDLPINPDKEFNGWAIGGVDGRSLGSLYFPGEEKKWNIFIKHCDFETKYCDFDNEETAGLKEFIYEHLNICKESNCHDGWRKCGGYDGRYSEVVFGKKIEKLCHSPLGFYNPTAEEMEDIKKLIKILADKHMPAIRKQMLKTDSWNLHLK